MQLQELNSQQKQLFKDYGIIKLKDFFPLNYIQMIQNVFYEEFNKEGLFKNGEWFLEGISMNGVKKVLKKVKNKRVVSNFLSEQKLKDVICELLNEEEAIPMSKSSGVLFTLPNTDKWEVPSDAWHVDIPRLPHKESLGIQVFSFLENLATCSGGTLAIKGSHRLFNTEKLNSEKVKNKLGEFPYFKNLMSKEFEDRSWFTINQGKVLGVDVELIELFGDIGDIYLMDMRLLHSAAPNPRNKPRIMVAQRYLSEYVRKYYNNTNLK